MSTSAVAAPEIEPKLIVPFVRSVVTVFTTMVGITPKVLRPMVKANPAPSYDVSGIIGFSGDIVGNVIVSFERLAAERVVSKFAGCEMTVGSDDFVDAIGELTNMIAGHAKKDFGVDASITVPSVIVGAGHKIARLSHVPCVVIPCETPVGQVALEVNIGTNRKAA